MQRLIQISGHDRKRHKDSRQHFLMTENIALRVRPKLVHVIEPDIDADLLALLHLSSSCRKDSLRDVHQHLH
jgi:hypothetical protein